jgi:hypothetical protein
MGIIVEECELQKGLKEEWLSFVKITRKQTNKVTGYCLNQQKFIATIYTQSHTGH